MKISDFPFFRDISEADTRSLIEHTRRVEFQPGETILAKGSRIECVYFIVKGRIKESTYSRSGKEIVFSTLEQGDCFGIVSPHQMECTKSDFIACTRAEVFAVRVSEFIRLMRADPSVTESVLDEVTNQAHKFSDKLYEIRAMDVPARTRAELLRHMSHAACAQGSSFAEIDNLPTHEEIANRIFTHREAVSREISKLKRDGIIFRTANNRLVANIGLLQKMVGEFS